MAEHFGGKQGGKGSGFNDENGGKFERGASDFGGDIGIGRLDVKVLIVAFYKGVKFQVMVDAGKFGVFQLQDVESDIGVFFLECVDDIFNGRSHGSLPVARNHQRDCWWLGSD